MSLGLVELVFVVVGTIIATSFVWVLFWRASDAENPEFADDPIVFLTSGDDIIDTTAQAALLLKRSGVNQDSRESLIHLLDTSFTGLPDMIRTLQNEPIRIFATDGTGACLRVTPQGHGLRFEISSPSDCSTTLINALCVATENAELAVLRDAVKSAPTMMWRCNAKGELVWANDAYVAMADACAQEAYETPRLSTSPLFKELSDPATAQQSAMRLALTKRDETAAHWFDVSTTTSGNAAFHYATDADAIVRAELAQRKFMQTLSQTFAQLSIGLAIFDRKKQLSTFNPALLDMTQLNFEFLSSRPTLDTILDRLRDSRMLPEPKNYASWRDQFSAMEQAAKDGTYSENWNLPDGQTFRVTGRPHPDGAFALLFEDISAEISLTRRFRSEIETSQAVLDHIPDAVAVFSNSGNLVLANAAYCALWGTDLHLGLMQYDLRIELRKWQDRCTPSRIWTNLREFTTQIGLRQPWSDAAIMDDGRHITCQADPIAGGMTLIRFRFDKPKSPTIQRLTQRDEALMSYKA